VPVTTFSTFDRISDTPYRPITSARISTPPVRSIEPKV